jgi:hypothetical protein
MPPLVDSITPLTVSFDPGLMLPMPMLPDCRKVNRLFEP